MKIGVFDSGIGGEAIASSLRDAFPDIQFDTVNDHENVPYGEKSPELVRELTEKCIQPFLDGSYEIIILACNTATALAIEFLRDKYPDQKFIGLEPMVKPVANLTKSGIVAVCATPATLASERYSRLKQLYAQNITIIEPDCSQWARLIEDNSLNESAINTTIDTAIKDGADVIVLACTHYHWIRTEIEKVSNGRADVIDPSEAIAKRVAELIEI